MVGGWAETLSRFCALRNSKKTTYLGCVWGGDV